jgi:hypothetical protein
MTAGSTHQRNPAVGWDITASAKTEGSEKIARVRILVNGSSEYDKTFDPPISNWQTQLVQQGQYPGGNTVRVIATNDKGEDAESDDSWS